MSIARCQSPFLHLCVHRNLSRGLTFGGTRVHLWGAPGKELLSSRNEHLQRLPRTTKCPSILANVLRVRGEQPFGTQSESLFRRFFVPSPAQPALERIHISVKDRRKIQRHDLC